MEVKLLNDNLWYPTDKIFINGQWKDCHSKNRLPIENPSNGEVIAEISDSCDIDIDEAVNSASKALDNSWGDLTASERGRLLLKLSELVRNRIDNLAIIESFDVGKPLKQAKSDALALARYFEFYGGASDKIMGETIPYLKDYTVYTLREPHGVTGHIIPWNYPMQIIGRTLGASLAMGNACVLKPSEEACLTALAIGQLANEAGFPEGSINIVTGLGEKAGSSLIKHPDINHISFTGSVEIGKKFKLKLPKI